tara:strand:+ start:6766 stop:7092 length:327 start_codon:yes stop_codon:yes gene_type:complete
MMARINAAQRPLYIIAPSLAECHKAALANGLNPAGLENVRCITRADHLRGTRAGTPFITHNRAHWVKAMPGVFDLDQAIDVMVRTGRLRVAQSDDLAAARGESAEVVR